MPDSVGSKRHRLHGKAKPRERPRATESQRSLLHAIRTAMAKGTKRKKPGVGIDFRRVKSKVGKKLPKAQNETDMSFKSKSINLPGQSLTEDKTGLAVSQRNLTTQVRLVEPAALFQHLAATGLHTSRKHAGTSKPSISLQRAGAKRCPDRPATTVSGAPSRDPQAGVGMACCALHISMHAIHDILQWRYV